MWKRCSVKFPQQAQIDDENVQMKESAEILCIITAKYSFQLKKSQSIQSCIYYFAFLSWATKIIDHKKKITFGNRNRARYHALKSAKRWTWSPLESCTSTTFRLISVWPIRKARTTNWMESPANEQNSNAVASSPAHMWLRYPRQEILIAGSFLIARSLFFALSFRLHRSTCIRVPCDVTLSPIVDSRPSRAVLPS